MTSVINKPLLTLTPIAMAHIQKWVLKEQGEGLRVAVKKTGCSGYMYVTEVIKSIPSEDRVLEIPSPLPQQPALRIYIDAESAPLLEGMQIDYGKPSNQMQANPLEGARLLFTNPNQTGMCGCGESFKVG